MTKSRIPEDAVLIRRFSKLDKKIEIFSGGKHMRFMIVVGRKGIQKSTLVAEAMPGAVVRSGRISAYGLYNFLWKNRDRDIVIDDADRIKANDAMVATLKSLTDTRQRSREVYWTSQTAEIRRGEVPGSFTTKSRVVFLANRWTDKVDDDVTALADRANYFVYFKPDNAEVHRRTSTWFWDQEIYDWIGKHLHLATGLSMRDYVRAWEAKKDGDDEWNDDLLRKWLRDPVLAIVGELQSKQLSSEEERVRRFRAKTGMSRATYYRYRDQLPKPSDEEVPQLPPWNKPPERVA